MTEVPRRKDRTPLGLLLYLEIFRTPLGLLLYLEIFRTPLGLLLYFDIFSLCSGGPGPPSAPVHPPLSTPRRALRGGVPRPLRPPAPGTTAVLGQKKKQKKTKCRGGPGAPPRPALPAHTLPLSLSALGRPLIGPRRPPPAAPGIQAHSEKNCSLTSGRRRGATCRPRRSRTKGWIEG